VSKQRRRLLPVTRAEEEDFPLIDLRNTHPVTLLLSTAAHLTMSLPAQEGQTVMSFFNFLK